MVTGIGRDGGGLVAASVLDRALERIRLSVILPTLDERDNLRALVPELLAAVPHLDEIIVVDDGSTDGTREFVRDYHHRDRRVVLIEREGAPNLTRAIQDGLDAARGEFVAWMDADQSMSPADLARLVDAVVAGADVAVGSRFSPDGGIKGQTHGGSWGRLRALGSLGNSEDSWLGVALSWFLNGALLPALLGDGVHDYTSGFVVARADALRPLRLRGQHGEYFIDLWMRARRSGLHIVEVGYRIKPRTLGRSKTAEHLFDYARRGVRYLGAAITARWAS